MPDSNVTSQFAIVVDRTAAAKPLSQQISMTLRDAIIEGRIETGARLPSWRDLAVQLGVARGTVRAAYEILADERLVVSMGAAGTHVAERRQESLLEAGKSGTVEITRPLQTLMRGFSVPALPFMSGVPAQDAFPAKLWSRIQIRAVRDDVALPTTYSDPRGQPELRAQIASYLAIARGIRCVPDQVIITNGYRSGLNLAIRALNAEGRKAWMEEPGFPITVWGLEQANVKLVPVPVDQFGIDVDYGIAHAPDAAVAVVTPGQQAPTGVSLSPERRRALLRWAAREDAWVIEDDYLSELQLEGRAAPALAADDPDGRVIHVGSFSKTLKPSLCLGFIVAPISLAERFGEVAGCMSPASSPVLQATLATFLSEGHYLRHLRHMKRLYAARRDALRTHWANFTGEESLAGLAMLMRLPDGTDDVAITKRAPAHDIAPTPLSPWYGIPEQRRSGLILSVTNLDEARVGPACAVLKSILRSM